MTKTHTVQKRQHTASLFRYTTRLRKINKQRRPLMKNLKQVLVMLTQQIATPLNQTLKQLPQQLIVRHQKQKPQKIFKVRKALKAIGKVRNKGKVPKAISISRQNVLLLNLIKRN